MNPEEKLADLIGYWKNKALITPNRFKYKSLSDWAYNIAVGCNHGCTFCYVPSASTNRMGGEEGPLTALGVTDPDQQWGDYVFLREWDEQAFISSLRKAEARTDLTRDGNRAVMLCTTTDAYQTTEKKEWNQKRQHLVRRSLELIRDHSTINVRILSRSPLAREDFDLFKTFGKRLVFGMSVPTLQNRLAKVYEPNAPAPSQRIATLQRAKDAGLHVYVAVAPTYPECDFYDLKETLKAVREIQPITIFHEPINIRAENISRIEKNAEAEGVTLNTSVFSTLPSWRAYAVNALRDVESIAAELGVKDRLHLWPDATLGTKIAASEREDSASHLAWLQKAWNRISEWPN